jgi:hypothetical protein
MRVITGIRQNLQMEYETVREPLKYNPYGEQKQRDLLTFGRVQFIFRGLKY